MTATTAATLTLASIPFDLEEVDLPGELFTHHPEMAEIIEFPTDWEPDPEVPAACALCLGEYDAGRAEADSQTGLCPLCASRLFTHPRAGGCGLALRLVAGATSGELAPLIGHLASCYACRDFFTELGEAARVAQFEADHAPAQGQGQDRGTASAAVPAQLAA